MIDSERMRALFAFSMCVLLVPKLVGALRMLVDGARRRGHGGAPRFVASVLLEVLLSALYAPILMLLRTRQLVEIALGRDSGWNLQRRGSEGLPWALVWRRHAGHVAAGLVPFAALATVAPLLLPWMSPIVAGLVLAAPLSTWSADARLGRRLARAGFLLVPEEIERPAPFRSRDARLPGYSEVVASSDLRRPFVDERARRAHFATVPPPTSAPRGRPRPVHLSTRAKLAEADTVEELLGWLDPAERLVLLGDRELFDRAVALENQR